MVSRYQKRISGPLLDRIDIHVEVPRVDYDKLSSDRLGEPSVRIRERVEAARGIQRRRFEGTDLACNADMGPAHPETGPHHCRFGRFGAHRDGASFDFAQDRPGRGHPYRPRRQM